MANLVFAVIGSTSFKLTGYGGTRELLIGIGILVIACLLHAYCRLAEDRQSVRMRDLTEDTPGPALLVGQAPV